MKTIPITGGAGFIGSHVVRLFVNKYPDYKIINLDKLTYAGTCLTKRIYAVIDLLTPSPIGKILLELILVFFYYSLISVMAIAKINQAIMCFNERQ